MKSTVLPLLNTPRKNYNFANYNGVKDKEDRSDANIIDELLLTSRYNGGGDSSPQNNSDIEKVYIPNLDSAEDSFGTIY